MRYKCSINFIIDIIMFLLMAAIGGIGFLIKYVLVSGSERWEIYHENVDLLFWGLDRHQWGAIHLILGYILFGLLFFHILFHWDLIKVLYQKLVRVKLSRVIFTVLFVMLSSLLLFFPFLITVDVVSHVSGEGRGHMHQQDTYTGYGRMHEHDTHESHTDAGDAGPYPSVENGNGPRHGHAGDIHGRMTLAHVADMYQVQPDSLKRWLGIPIQTSSSSKLGRLRRTYGFQMKVIQDIIEEHRMLTPSCR